jgi:AcrR family transcriptional regulator
MTARPQDDQGRRRRSDFEQNRAAIIEAADAAFADLGPDVSIGAIAERAGVAPATIYRHFPNRRALGKAVYDLRLDLYTEAVANAQQVDDPAESFRQAVHGIVELQARDRSFKDLIETYEDGLPEIDGSSKLARFSAAMLATIHRGREAGAIRSDVTDADVALLLLASEGIASLATEHSELPLQRVVNVILDGIMSTTTELDDSPLSHDELFKLT